VVGQWPLFSRGRDGIRAGQVAGQVIGVAYGHLLALALAIFKLRLVSMGGRCPLGLASDELPPQVLSEFLGDEPLAWNLWPLAIIRSFLALVFLF